MNTRSRHATRLGLAAILALTTVGAALARPDTRAMTCTQTQNLIVRSGAVVMTTGRHTYDRFVGPGGQCFWPEVPAVTYVRTKDMQHCPVHNCQRYDPPFWDD